MQNGNHGTNYTGAWARVRSRRWVLAAARMRSETPLPRGPLYRYSREGRKGGEGRKVLKTARSSFPRRPHARHSREGRTLVIPYKPRSDYVYPGTLGRGRDAESFPRLRA